MPTLTLLHSEWPKLHEVLAILSAIGLNRYDVRYHGVINKLILGCSTCVILFVGGTVPHVRFHCIGQPYTAIR